MAKTDEEQKKGRYIGILPCVFANEGTDLYSEWNSLAMSRFPKS